MFETGQLSTHRRGTALQRERRKPDNPCAPYLAVRAGFQTCGQIHPTALPRGRFPPCWQRFRDVDHTETAPDWGLLKGCALCWPKSERN
jgi:hypothetical protein